MDLHFTHRELAYLRVLPLFQPSSAVEHCAIGSDAKKCRGKMALDIEPVFLLDGLPHQGVILAPPKWVLPRGMLGFSCAAGKQKTNHKGHEETQRKQEPEFSFAETQHAIMCQSR